MDARQANIDKHFITITAADRAEPGKVEELRRLAAETGKLLVETAQETPHARAVREHLNAEGMPSIARDDRRGFLGNLGKIAAGEMRVEGMPDDAGKVAE